MTTRVRFFLSHNEAYKQKMAHFNEKFSIKETAVQGSLCVSNDVTSSCITMFVVAVLRWKKACHVMKMYTTVSCFLQMLQ